MATNQTVPVTRRALIQRAKRKLQQQGRTLNAARGPMVRQKLGDFYVTNREESVIAKYQRLEDLVRDLGVLKPYERLVED